MCMQYRIYVLPDKYLKHKKKDYKKTNLELFNK